MIQFNVQNWKTHDPDGILRVDRDKFAIEYLKFLGDFHPREDFLSFENIDTKIIVDFGFYGNEVNLSGVWRIYVVDGNLEDGWHSPLEQHKFVFSDFFQGINCVQLLLVKYS